MPETMAMAIRKPPKTVFIPKVFCKSTFIFLTPITVDKNTPKAEN